MRRRSSARRRERASRSYSVGTVGTMGTGCATPRQTRRNIIVRAGTVLSSPRSALCCLRAGVDPRDLIPLPLAQFQKEAELEGAAKHIPYRRWEHFEQERQRTLAELRMVYAAMCEAVSMPRLVSLLQRYSPENNPDQALLKDDAEIDESALPPATRAEAGAARAARQLRELVRDVFLRTDADNNGVVSFDELKRGLHDDEDLNDLISRAVSPGKTAVGGKKQKAGGGKQRQEEHRMAAKLFSKLDDNKDHNVNWKEFEQEVCEALGISQESIATSSYDIAPTKIEKFRQRNEQRLAETRQRLEGHLMRTIRMRCQRSQRFESKRTHFESHMQGFAKQRTDEQRRRRELARERESACAEKVKQIKQRDLLRQKELLRRFDDEDGRVARVLATVPSNSRCGGSRRGWRHGIR